MTQSASNTGPDSPHNDRSEYEAPVPLSSADEALDIPASVIPLRRWETTCRRGGWPTTVGGCAVDQRQSVEPPNDPPLPRRPFSRSPTRCGWGRACVGIATLGLVPVE